MTSPVNRVIGFGRIKKKFIDETLIWLDEILFRKPIWKFLLQFEKLYAIDDWTAGIPVSANIMLNTGRKVIDRRTFLKLLKYAESKWYQELQTKLEFDTP